VYVLHELAGGRWRQCPTCVRISIDDGVNISIPKSHIECDSIVSGGVGSRGSNDFGLVCTRPCFAPGNLTGLTRFPTDCSGRVISWEWSSDCSWSG
jgi:hypothetical protein